MGQRARVKERPGVIAEGLFLLAALICALFLWTSAAGAEPGRGRPDLSTDPKRSYGAIDVILYQTSW